jgi:FkbM family methyltransferase
MALERINFNPRMTRRLIQQSTFAQSPLVVVDVGARGGNEIHWQVYESQLHQIAFEPDVEECERLNQQFAATNRSFYPVALGAQAEKRPFYLCQGRGGSSFYPANLTFLERFSAEHAEHLQVAEQIELETIDLDTFAQTNQLPAIDFIKLDVEGSELDCLKGAARTLQQSVLGLSLEILFHASLRQQPTFSEIDFYLNAQGFRLFDMSLYRHARRALPFPASDIGVTRQGQVLWGQVLYLRDGVAEIQAGERLAHWTETTVLKLASMMEIFCLPDCAAELLQVADYHQMMTQPIAPLLNDLTPVLRRGEATRPIAYQDYLNHFGCSA